MKFPEFDFTTLVQLIGPASTTALLGSIESFCPRPAPMAWRTPGMIQNQELIGQGIAKHRGTVVRRFCRDGGHRAHRHKYPRWG